MIIIMAALPTSHVGPFALSHPTSLHMVDKYSVQDRFRQRAERPEIVPSLDFESRCRLHEGPAHLALLGVITKHVFDLGTHLRPLGNIGHHILKIASCTQPAMSRLLAIPGGF
jgi:hypothetical protein